jgi:hypothetical protein
VIRSCLLLFALLAAAQAPPRGSANYSVAADSVADGSRSGSAGYTNDGSMGDIGGLSSAASPAKSAKTGYVGQLYEISALQVSAPSLTVNEGGTLQLNAAHLLDDATTITLPSNSIAWSVQSGPITNISSGGLATAGIVYQDSAATVQGTFLGNTGSLNLTVLNVNHDDFGSYAGDGIDDAWQMQNFGANNSGAGPNAISDGSGLTNLFKFTAGLVPNNAASRFNLSTTPVSGQPGQFNITFNPSLVDRQYTVESSIDLIHWNTLSGPFAGNGSTQTVTDSSSGGLKFYRVQITKP